MTGLQHSQTAVYAISFVLFQSDGVCDATSHHSEEILPADSSRSLYPIPSKTLSLKRPDSHLIHKPSAEEHPWRPPRCKRFHLRRWMPPPNNLPCSMELPVKGLQDKIKLVPLNLFNRPSWYKEKVYPVNKVPSLEHNGKVIGESLDLLKYIDSNFEGPSLLPDDPGKREYGEELLSYSETFNGTIISAFKGDIAKEAGAQFDYLENALQKFDGPFLLGEISQVDIAYIPFVERFQVFLLEALKYDITEGRPKLAAWIEEFNKIDAYKQTKVDPKLVVEVYTKRFLG